VFVNLTGGERTGEPASKKITWMQRGQNGWTEEKLPRPRPTSANRMDRDLPEIHSRASAREPNASRKFNGKDASAGWR
jgi:hypothetical protein